MPCDSGRNEPPVMIQKLDVQDCSVLHVTHAMKIGGQERAVYQLVRAQHQAGRKVGQVSLSLGGHFADLLGSEGISVYEVRQRGALDVKAARRFLRTCDGYEVVHFHVPSPLMMAASGRVGKVVAYTHRAGMHRYGFRRKVVYSATGLVLRRVARAISANTRHAGVVASRLFGIPSDKVHVTYNCIDESLLRPLRSPEDVRAELGVSKDQPIVCTTGNLRRLKRVDMLIRAFAAVRRKDAVLLVIGGGPELRSLQVLAGEYGRDKIRFLGQRENVFDYLQISALFVLASDRSESFGNSAVEAMAMGVPTVVMADGGGVVEHFPDDCFRLPDSEESLSSLMSWLLGRPADAARIGEQCRSFVLQKYSVRNMVSCYNKYYASLALC